MQAGLANGRGLGNSEAAVPCRRARRRLERGRAQPYSPPGFRLAERPVASRIAGRPTEGLMPGRPGSGGGVLFFLPCHRRRWRVLFGFVRGGGSCSSFPATGGDGGFFLVMSVTRLLLCWLSLSAGQPSRQAPVSVVN